MAAFVSVACQSFSQEDPVFSRDEAYSILDSKVIEKYVIPKWYHEGLLCHEGKIFINNGEKGNTWLFDPASGRILGDIIPPATFSEGISYAGDGTFWFTDWDTKMLYRIRIKDNKMIPEFELTLEPSYPVGVSWTGEKLYVVIWTRGMGTRYDLLEIDGKGKILRKIRIRRMHEPVHMAWDGKNLWIASWYTPLIYQLDISTCEIKAAFRSPISDTTGIAWDGEYFWVTGTKSDLYKIKLNNPL